MGAPIPDEASSQEIAAEKMRLRTHMRKLRRGLVDREQRSAQICAAIQGLEIWSDSPMNVMVFTPILGEPDLTALRRWCDTRGDLVTTPEDGPDPQGVDLVIVPGLAFTDAGARLGQGGGWYDRFLALTRTDCVCVGVGFAVQIQEILPWENHDVVMDHVVTEEGRIGPVQSPW
jgi:5-formyltetrahydrofolate cyclo-ligase